MSTQNHQRTLDVRYLKARCEHLSRCCEALEQMARQCHDRELPREFALRGIQSEVNGVVKMFLDVISDDGITIPTAINLSKNANFAGSDFSGCIAEFSTDGSGAGCQLDVSGFASANLFPIARYTLTLRLTNRITYLPQPDLKTLRFEFTTPASGRYVFSPPDPNATTKSLPSSLSPAMYLIGYAAAAFFGVDGKRDPNSGEARTSQSNLAFLLMRECPDACSKVATAMHNSYLGSTKKPLIENWDKYIAANRQAEKENEKNP